MSIALDHRGKNDAAEIAENVTALSGEGVNVHDLPDAVEVVTAAYDASLNELQSLASGSTDINLTQATYLTAEVQVNSAISEMVQGVVKNAADALKKNGQKLG